MQLHALFADQLAAASATFKHKRQHEICKYQLPSSVVSCCCPCYQQCAAPKCGRCWYTYYSGCRRVCNKTGRLNPTPHPKFPAMLRLRSTQAEREMGPLAQSEWALRMTVVVEKPCFRAEATSCAIGTGVVCIVSPRHGQVCPRCAAWQQPRKKPGH